MELYNKIDTIFENGLIGSTLSMLLSLVFVLLINHILNRWIEKKHKENEQIAKRVKKILIITFLLCTICAEVKPFQALMKALLASGGILALVVGLASQEAASNMINGFMIYAYRPYKVNDFINVVDLQVTGTVKDITLRHTIIETLEKTQIIIPNTKMNNAVIENISNVPNKKANYLFLDISYESDVDQAILIIQKEAMQHPLIVDPRSPKEKDQPMVPVLCTELTDSSVKLRATIYSKDNATGFQMLSDLRINIKKAFEKNNIEIPYPHITIK